MRLALYVFGLRDRPVRNTRITSDDADKLATAISTFRYDVNARKPGARSDYAIASRLNLASVMANGENMRQGPASADHPADRAGSVPADRMSYLRVVSQRPGRPRR